MTSVAVDRPQPFATARGGRGIVAQGVAELAAAPNGIEDLKDGYDLSEAEIADARRWWREVRRLEAA